ncbi:MAG: zinc-ribbon domain-containing protein [Calditrichaeota bacterium]|nr:MAG: zinc-ribbon domain-containing protein [Calditrichota bacterium]
MKKCTQCGHELDDNAKFCSSCGTKAQEEKASSERRCVNCDALQKEGAKFCHICGSPYVSEAESKKILDASWDDYKVGKKGRKRATGTIYPIILIPALVVFIFFITQNDRDPMHDDHEAQQQQPAQQQPSMEQMQQHFAEIDSLKLVLEENPDDTTALEKLGTYYEIAGKFSDARNYFTQLQRLHPDNNETAMRVANTYYAEKNYLAAIQEIEKVLERAPNDLLALYNHGLLLSLIGNKEGAREQWEKVVSIDKDGKMAKSAQQAIQFLNQN